jgi:MFS family permease
METRRLFTYENALLLILGSGFGFAFFDRQAITYLTPFIVPDLHLNNTEVGALTSGLALAWAVSAYAIGAWSDATGVRKPFLVAAIVVFSLCSVLTGLAGSFALLLAARVIMGAVEGPFLPICLAMMSAESSPHRRGLNAGVMQNSFSNTILIFAPVVLVWLAKTFSWRWAFFISAAPGMILLLLVLKVVREPKRPVHVTPEAATAAAGMAGSAAPTPVAEHEDLIQAPKLGLIQLLAQRNIWLCCLISCCMVSWATQAASFLPLFYVQFRHFTPDQMAGLMSMLGLSAVGSGPVAAAISDRVGRKPVLVVFCLLGLVAPLGALYYSGPLAGLAALIFIGWLGTGTYPLFMGTIPAETVSFRYAATCMGLIVCVGELIGGFLTPIAAGRAADLTTLQAPLFISAASAALAAVFSLFLIETAPAKRAMAANAAS